MHDCGIVYIPNSPYLLCIMTKGNSNDKLLKVISDMHPDSIASLAALTGRSSSNLSRTLKTMSNYGLVEMQPINLKQFRPVAKATSFRIVAEA